MVSLSAPRLATETHFKFQNSKKKKSFLEFSVRPLGDWGGGDCVGPLATPLTQ